MFKTPITKELLELQGTIIGNVVGLLVEMQCLDLFKRFVSVL